MKHNYMEPKLEIFKFGVEDIMATSGEGFNPNAEEGNNEWIVGDGNGTGDTPGFSL